MAGLYASAHVSRTAKFIINYTGAFLWHVKTEYFTQNKVNQRYVLDVIPHLSFPVIFLPSFILSSSN